MPETRPSELRSFFSGLFKPRGRSPLADIAAEHGLMFDKKPAETSSLHGDWQSELGATLAGSYGHHKYRNLAWGIHRGRKLMAFDLAKVERLGDGPVNTYWFSCVLVVLDVTLPSLTIGQENVLSRLVEKIPGVSDLKVGLEEFDRRFMVSAQPPEFAAEMLDAAMVDWLMSQPMPVSYEVDRDTLVLRRDPLRGSEARAHWETMIEMAHGFCDRIPASVLEHYRGPGSLELSEHGEREIPRSFEVGDAPRVKPRSKGFLGAAAGIIKAAKPPPGIEAAPPRDVQDRLLGIWGRGITTGVHDDHIVIVWAAEVAADRQDAHAECRYRAVRIRLDPRTRRATGTFVKAEKPQALDRGRRLRRSSLWEAGTHTGAETIRVLRWLGEEPGDPTPGDFTFSWEALREAVVEAVTGAGWTFAPKVVGGWPG